MSDLKIVTGWALKKTSDGMTLTGRCNGSPVRMPVKTVSPEGGRVLAQTKEGDIFVLHV